jgi:uncharacterized membrane protein
MSARSDATVTLTVTRPNPRSTDEIRAPALHVRLASVPIVCFCFTLITDVVYWQTANMQWANMSAWFLTIGLIVAAIALVAGIIDFLRDARPRQLRPARIHLRGYIAALVLAIINALVHTRDAYTSVVPAGLILSTLVVLILAVTDWSGRRRVHRYGVEIAETRP